MVTYISDGLEMFRDYLRKEFSDENIEFWISCEEYKRLKSADRPPVAKSIFDNYVAIQAPHEVRVYINMSISFDNKCVDTRSEFMLLIMST